MPAADPEPVPIGDLEVADRIARAVRRGGPAERRPTIEQIVAAFGEASPTPDARRRAARALALAGVATVPELSEAAPGQRVALEVRRTRRRRALFFGILALAALMGAAAAVAGTVDFGNDETVADLPAGTSGAPTAELTNSAPTTTAATSSQPTAAERRRARRARERRARERRARERRARARAAARRRVTVRLNATLPTFLCVDGDGRRLFDGTLSGARTFRAREVRMNVGLGPSTRVTANGKAVALVGSPTGVAITRRGRTFLPLGARPCA
ncbi:MAG TPA: hypothetical protein VH834_15630 [Solirubrobacteraceae bacterium]